MAAGTPPFAFKWLKDGRDSLLGSATTMVSDEVSTLFLKDLSVDDSGNYTCVASNSHASDRFTARLSVRCELQSDACP